MKNSFVLDEGVIICAAKGKNEHEVDDSSSVDLIRQIRENRHAIVWSVFLWGKWAEQFNTIRQTRQAQNLGVIRLLKAIISDSDLSVLIEDARPVEGEELLPNDEVDRHVVRLAAHNQAVLTTVDNRLIERLVEAGFTHTGGFIAVRPEVALLYAGPQ